MKTEGTILQTVVLVAAGGALFAGCDERAASRGVEGKRDAASDSHPPQDAGKPGVRDGSLGTGGRSGAGGAPSDAGSCRAYPLPSTGTLNCLLLDCESGSCHACSGSDVPEPTGATPAPCGDNPCNPSCQRFAELGTPVSPWPSGDGGEPPQVVRHYYYDAGPACPSGTEPQWDFLMFGTDTPGDSAVWFHARTLTSPGAGADAANYPVGLGTSSRASGSLPQTCSMTNLAGQCPVSIFEALGNRNHGRILDLQVSLAPSPTDKPTAKWWEVRFSCVPLG